MVEFYPEIRLVHIAAVIASGSLFVARGLMALHGFGKGLLKPLHYLSYAIDTVLLTAALMLMTIVRQYPFIDAWLTVKVLLLAAYIGLGALVFRKALSYRARLGLWAASAAIYLFIISVARAHDPLGFLSGFAG
jgi:uncharacterized membrane protein SirB2